MILRRPGTATSKTPAIAASNSHPDGEYALEGEEGDLHGIPVLQDEDQQKQEDQRGEDQAGPQAACAGVLDRRRS
jgi:hypothetical protein